jgi:hypothetical protein
MSQQTGDVAGEGNAHYNISDASEEAGDTKRAIYHMQQAHACYVTCFGAEHSEAVDAHEQVERLGGVEEEEEEEQEEQEEEKEQEKEQEQEQEEPEGC